MAFLNRIYRLTALLLASLMFFSSVAFSLDMHYCQGKLKSASLFVKAKNCHELMAEMATCKHHQTMPSQALTNGCTLDTKDCCQNKTFFFHLDQDREVRTADFMANASLQHFALALVTVFFTNELDQENTSIAFQQYKPPLIPRDIPVLFQSFLL